MQQVVDPGIQIWIVGQRNQRNEIFFGYLENYRLKLVHLKTIHQFAKAMAEIRWGPSKRSKPDAIFLTDGKNSQPVWEEEAGLIDNFRGSKSHSLRI